MEETEAKVSEEQGRFREGKGCVDLIFASNDDRGVLKQG